jgi:hypothetical protein
VTDVTQIWAGERKQMGVVVGMGSQNPRPVAKNATRTGHPYAQYNVEEDSKTVGGGGILRLRVVCVFYIGGV